MTIQGSFAPNGASAPTNALGKGWSVARTAVGTFVITLQDSYVSLESLGTDLQFEAATANWSQFGPVDVVTAKTVTIYTVNSAGAPTDIAANSARRVNFGLGLVNSTVI